jgi:putative ABC transport system substrate-binding protein
MRRIGMLMAIAAADPEAARRIAAFRQPLQELGWTDGGNLRLDYPGALTFLIAFIEVRAESLALAPDVVVASSCTAMFAFQERTSTEPIVFAGIIDAVAGGRVTGLRQPGGHAIGFMSLEYGVGGKLLERLKEVVPRLQRAAVVGDPTTTTWRPYGAIQAVAPSFGVELSPIDLRDPGESERGVAAFAQAPNSGLIVPTSALATFRRETIIAAAARHRLPAIYPPAANFVGSGGLISYAPAVSDLWRGRRWVRRPHSQGHKAGRSAGADADQVRDGDQSQNR